MLSKVFLFCVLLTAIAAAGYTSNPTTKVAAQSLGKMLVCLNLTFIYFIILMTTTMIILFLRTEMKL